MVRSLAHPYPYALFRFPIIWPRQNLPMLLTETEPVVYSSADSCIICQPLRVSRGFLARKTSIPLYAKLSEGQTIDQALVPEESVYWDHLDALCKNAPTIWMGEARPSRRCCPTVPARASSLSSTPTSPFR